MSNTRTLLGIRKLVLIDSAGYDLGVFPIDAPLSVSGENNVGKSSAINALQFLFLSNIQHMYFGGYSNEDTRKYYFPRETSFALMEVILETGTYVVGAAGKGVAAGHGYQHFAYQGQFDFADYQEDDGTLRRLPEVMRAVHIKGARVHKFSPEELRQALMGQPTASNLEIGMVELRDASEKSYRTFNDLFKNLIHMKAVKGPQLKKLLISVFGNRLTTSQSVDYASAYQGARSAVNSLEDKLDVLLKIEPDVQRFTQYHQERLSLAGKLKAMMAGIETGIQAWDGSFKAETERLRTALGQTAGQISEIDRKNRESSDRIGKLAVEESTLNTWLSRLADFEREFALVRIDEVKARIEHQRAEYRKKLAVVSAANRPVPAISREMAQNQQAIARLERRLASLDANFFGLLQQVASHEELVLLLKLFQEGFLSVPVGTEGVQVSGAGSVRDFVDQVLGRCRDGCYREGGIAVNLAGLKSPSVKEFVDKDLLLEELSDRRARAATLAEEMDAAINSEAQQAQISRMEAALHDDEAFLRRHEEYQAMLKEREAKRLAFDKARQELAELKAFQQEAMGKTSALKDQEAQLGQSLRQLQAKNDSIGRKMAQLKRIDEAEESHPFAGEMPSDLESLADAYTEVLLAKSQ